MGPRGYYNLLIVWPTGLGREAGAPPEIRLVLRKLDLRGQGGQVYVWGGAAQRAAVRFQRRLHDALHALG